MKTARPMAARSERSGAIAVATRPGNCPFDFPKYPYEGRPQADNDAQEQQGQSRDREHVQHLCYEENGVPANRNSGLSVATTGTAGFMSAGPAEILSGRYLFDHGPSAADLN